jgi:hypothetical protein
MHQDPSSQEYADEVARLRASESDSDAELLVCLDMFSLYLTRYQKDSARGIIHQIRCLLSSSRVVYVIHGGKSDSDIRLL